MTARHEFRTSARSGSVTVTELPDRIRVEFAFSAYGDFGDAAEIRAALAPILARYAADPRPFEIPNQHSGETALVSETRAGTGFAVIAPPRRH